MLLSDAYPFHYLQREYPEDEGLLYVDLYHFKSTKNPKASFGFIGSNCIGEDIKYTKRFRFYSRIVATYFDTTFFTHKENTDKSTYMLINNAFWAEHPNLVDDIESFFTERYDYFD